MGNATTAATCRLQDAVFVPETSFGEGSLAIKIHVARRICPMARTVLAKL